ncbi:MAG: methionine--tRNA ligase [Acidimicrobiales bacterium]|nr:methionine--tRNA ligase [Acidimicrobiales bacterium]
MSIAYEDVKRFAVTTPIYYVNDAPHVGHAYCTLHADALARWHRLAGDEVFFLTGTDEHGLKVQQAADEKSMTPKEWADITSQRFKDAWQALDIKPDDFIRTTEPRHYQAVSKFLQAIYDNGFIELGSWEGLYCVGCEAYYTESELIDGNCPVHGTQVEVVQEENYFFKLSKFQDKLEKLYSENPNWVEPSTRRNEALSFIKSGLQDISITRTSIKWGVPVPWDTNHVFYVWYDALINYVTALGYGNDSERFNTWWPSVHHLIGKEIVRFHCVWWPAMCMAAGIDPPNHIFVHGWLLVKGEKMSKSKLNKIDPVVLAEEVGLDTLRYHLLRDTPFGPDGDFTYEGLVRRHDADLSNNLGNLLARVSTVIANKCAGIGPKPRENSPLKENFEEIITRVRESWEKTAPAASLEATFELIYLANAMLEQNEPWKMEPGVELEGILGDALEVLRLVALLIFPAIPKSAQEIWNRLGLKAEIEDTRLDDAAIWGQYPGSLPVTKGSPLFPRLGKSSKDLGESKK